VLFLGCCPKLETDGLTYNEGPIAFTVFMYESSRPSSIKSYDKKAEIKFIDLSKMW